MDTIPQDTPQKQCPKCEQWFPATVKSFGKNRSDKSGLQAYCKSCQRDIKAAFRAQKISQGFCRACFCRSTEPGHLCAHCYEKLKQVRDNNPKDFRAKHKQWRDKLHDQAIATYGGTCVDCGETNFAFLTIDHVNGGGNAHRRSIKGNFYHWLQKNEYPMDGTYQVLCYNCNWYHHVSNISPSVSTKNAEAIRKWINKLRNEVLAAYGNQCVCCGEDRPEVLTIDHINNDGNTHRLVIGSGGTTFYNWLRKQGFPRDNFQILCRSCNWAKSHYEDGCPHQRHS